MEYVFFGVFSVLVAVVFNFLNPKITSLPIFQSASAGGYVSRTLVTAASFFVVLIAAGFLMSIVVKRPQIPAV